MELKIAPQTPPYFFILVDPEHYRLIGYYGCIANIPEEVKAYKDIYEQARLFFLAGGEFIVIRSKQASSNI